MTSRNTTLGDFSLSDDWLNYTCQRCGVKFHASKSAKRKYCSDKCARAARKGVSISDEHKRKQSYSARHRNQASVVCYVCGKRFKKRPSMIERAEKHFCSRECYSKHNSEVYKGENNPQYGKPSSFKGRTMSLESRMKLSNSRMGQHNSPETEFTSERSKEMWKDPKTRDKITKACMVALQARPNKIESRIIHTIEKYDLPFKYVGDGEVIIYGLCPDFISTDDSNKIIEVFGEIFHDPDKQVKQYTKIRWTQQEFGRKAIFSQYGYDTLVIWENEIRSSTSKELYIKIKEFVDQE